MESSVSAAFTLTGLELDPVTVTALTGITPSISWQIGELIDERAALRHKQSGWRVESSLPPSAELGDHVKDVLARLRAGWAPLKGLAAQFGAEISCVLYVTYGGGTPSVNLDKDTVARIADLTADIDIDLYVLPGQ